MLEQAAQYLSKVRGVHRKEIVITNGSQEGAYITAKMLLNPGDRVAVENPGYINIFDVFRSIGADLDALDVGEDGLDPDDFRILCQKQKPQLLYLTPLHQYPTTSRLSTEKRREIYKICGNYDIPILEDDYDHEFHYKKRPLAPMAAHDPEQRIVYLATLSKLMFPSSRIGMAAVPKEIAPAFVRYKEILSGQNNRVMQWVTGAWMRDGGFEKHLRKMRRVYQLKRDYIHQELQGINRDTGDILSYHLPDGGLALWIRIPFDEDDFAEKCESHGVRIGKGSDYFEGQGKYSSFRFAFSGFSLDELKQITGILRRVITSMC